MKRAGEKILTPKNRPFAPAPLTGVQGRSYTIIFKKNTFRENFFYLNALNYIYAMKQIIALLGLGAIGIYLSSRATLIKSSNFSFEKMQLDIKAKKIYVYLGVSNPSNSSMTIKAITGNLSLNGSDIAAVQSFTDQPIKARSKSLIKLQLVPSAIGILQQAKIFLLNAISKKDKNVKSKINAKFTGAANVDTLVIPLELSLI